MEQMDLFVSWMREAVNGVSRKSFDPESWGILFAVLALVSFWSIVRSLNRLARQLLSALTELSEIRSTLKELERRVGPGKASPPANDQGGKDILTLPLRERDERR